MPKITVFDENHCFLMFFGKYILYFSGNSSDLTVASLDLTVASLDLTGLHWTQLDPTGLQKSKSVHKRVQKRVKNQRRFLDP